MPGRHAIGSLLGGGNDREPLHGRDHWDHRLATEASFQSKISTVRAGGWILKKFFKNGFT